jgi:hypothetical protein
MKRTETLDAPKKSGLVNQHEGRETPSWPKDRAGFSLLVTNFAVPESQIEPTATAIVAGLLSLVEAHLQRHCHASERARPKGSP